MELLSNIFYYVVPFLIVLGVLVFVHEFGHFIVARIFGIKVDEFSIGFGKKLFGFVDKKQTTWKVCAIPLGGYVKMFGDENAASANSGAANALSEEDKKVAFEFKHPFKKLLVVLAGPLFNYIFAILVFAGLFFFVGKIYTPSVVGDVMPASPAFEAGIKKDDLIKSVDGREVKTFDELRKEVALSVGEKTRIVVDRNGKEIVFDIALKELQDPNIKPQDDDAKRKMWGVLSSQITAKNIQSMGFFEAIKEGSIEAYDITVLTLRGVGQMITGKRSAEDVGGIIRIAEMSGDVSKNKNIADFLMFMALLSVNLGLINLFPIPVLDGGHIVIYSIETISGKKVGDKLKEWLAKFGFAIIMTLLVFATYNDIIRFFK